MPQPARKKQKTFTHNTYREVMLQEKARREQVEGTQRTHSCALTGANYRAPRAIEGALVPHEEAKAKRAVVPKSVFDALPCTSAFGQAWLQASVGALKDVKELIRCLFDALPSGATSLTIPLICDQAVVPRDNGGNRSVADLMSPEWTRFIKQVRVDVAFQALVSRVARTSFGCEATVYPLTLHAWETYTWATPFELTILPHSSYEISVLTISPMLR